MATGYKIEDMKMQKLWLILSADSFVCADNLKIITKIAEENYIDADSISVLTALNLISMKWKTLHRR